MILRVRPRLPLITVFGLGHMRPASGTWGSMPPVVIAALLWLMGATPLASGAPARGIAVAAGEQGHALALVVYLATMACICLVFSAACVAQGAAAEAIFGHDPAEVVADETAGQCLPLLALAVVPACFASLWTTAAWLGAGFVAFRIFDIAKPWPAGALQRVPGGWGILLDDLAAGVYAAAIMVGAAWWLA
jgi:phosphatidylglycerophosphatase A